MTGTGAVNGASTRAAPCRHPSNAQVGSLGGRGRRPQDRPTMPAPDTPRIGGPPRRAVAGCAAVWGASVAGALTGTAGQPVVVAAAQGLVVGLPMAAGPATYARASRVPQPLPPPGGGR